MCNESCARPVVVRRPTLIDMAQVYRQSNQENLEQAFSVAERELGVTRLLDPEGESAHVGTFNAVALQSVTPVTSVVPLYSILYSSSFVGMCT